MWKIYRKPMRCSFLRMFSAANVAKLSLAMVRPFAEGRITTERGFCMIYQEPFPMSGQYPAVPRASAGINHDTHFSNPSMFLVVEQHSTIFEVRKKMFQLFHINYYWIIRKHALKSCIQWCLSSEPCSKITNRSNGGFLKWGYPVLPNHLFE